MRVRTMKDIGAAIRSRRKALGIDQAELAARTGVGREWIIEAEKGKARAEAGLVLRTLEALDLTISITEPPQTLNRLLGGMRKKLDQQSVDIDRIVERARGLKR